MYINNFCHIEIYLPHVFVVSLYFSQMAEVLFFVKNFPVHRELVFGLHDEAQCRSWSLLEITVCRWFTAIGFIV